MPEHAPPPQPGAASLAEQQSPSLPFGSERPLADDPATAEDFNRALRYLDLITHHWLEFGPWWEKQAQDVVDELDYHNAWHQYAVEQEHKAGEQTAEYRAIQLNQLHALSKRRVLALEEAGWAVTQAYQVVQYVDALIEQAVREQAQLEQVMLAGPAPTAPAELPRTTADDVPF